VSRLAVAVVLAFAVMAIGGCGRARYVDFYAARPVPAQYDIDRAKVPDDGVQRFFLLGGVAPAERVVDAAAICGVGQITDIRTKRTFQQGLVRLVTFGMYAPYTAQTICAWHWR
jgi:hypothetical protein